MLWPQKWPVVEDMEDKSELLLPVQSIGVPALLDAETKLFSFLNTKT